MDSSSRPRLGHLASCLIEARLSGISFWDTDAGQQLMTRTGRKPPPPEQHPEQHPDQPGWGQAGTQARGRSRYRRSRVRRRHAGEGQTS